MIEHNEREIEGHSIVSKTNLKNFESVATTNWSMNKIDWFKINLSQVTVG